MQSIDTIYQHCQGNLLILAPGGKNPIEPNWSVVPSKVNGDASGYLDVGYNIGYRLTERDLIIDIDPRNGGDSSFLSLPHDIQQLPTTTDTANAGRHIYTKLPKGFDYRTLRSTLADYPGIDFLHKGKQVVLPGSSLQDGKTWSISPAFALPVPETPNSLLLLLTREQKPRTEHAPSGHLTALELSTLLEQIPVASYRDNDSWLRLTMACHHATAGEGLEVFRSWSLVDPLYSDQGDIIQQRWQSFGEDRTPAPVTIRTLVREISRHGVAPSWLLVRAGLSNNGIDLLDAVAEESTETVFDRLNNMIGVEQNPVKLLTTIAVQIASTSEINDSMRTILYKAIAKKTGTTVPSIRKDIKTLSSSRVSSEANPEQTDSVPMDVTPIDSSQIHTNAAQAALAAITTASHNVSPIYCMNKWWCWTGAFWDSELSEADIRRRVLQVLIAQGVQATNSTVVAVSELMSTMREQPASALAADHQALRIFTPYTALDYDRINHRWSSVPHSPTYRNLSVIGAVYDENAAPPVNWFRFLDEVTTSEHAKRTIGCAIVYAATSVRPWLRKAFYLYGPPRSGKSTALDAIQTILGDKNCSALNMSQLGSTFGASSLVGKLANISNEMLSKKAIQDDVFKLMISGETLMVEKKFGDMFQYANTAKMFFGANGFPRILDESEAVWDRLCILHFPNAWPEAKADHTLKDKLHDERSGILKWALDIFVEEFKKDECRSVTRMDLAGEAVLQQWRETNNPALEWVKARVVRDPDTDSTLDQLYADYRLWCRNSGHREAASNHFSRVIGKILHRHRNTEGAVIFSGVKLKPFEGGLL